MKVRVNEEKRNCNPSLYTDDLLTGKVYTVTEITHEWHWYRIIDESGEAYRYPPELLEVVEK